MTRRCLLLAAPAAPCLAVPQLEPRTEACLLLVHDLSDFAVHYTALRVQLMPSRIAVRYHPDFWPGAGAPRRWEAWLEDASGNRAVRVVADPAYASLPVRPPSAAAAAIARRLGSHWLRG